MFIESRPHAEIIQRIEAAGLRSSTYRTARRLVDMAGENGHITLTKAQVVAICEVSTWSSARNHLTALSGRGILHYSTNEKVYINIYGAPQHQQAVHPVSAQMHPVSAQMHPVSAQVHPVSAQVHPVSAQAHPVSAQVHPVSAQTHPVSAQNDITEGVRSVNAQMHPVSAQMDSVNAEDPTVCLFVVNTPTHPGEQEQTNKQTTVHILTDDAVGLAPATAERFRNDDPQWVMGHVFAWLHDLEAGRVRGHGALIHRLEKGWDSPPPSEADRATPLYRRHFGDDIERRREYLPDEYAGIIRG